MREILFRGKSQYTGKWGESVCPLGMMHSGHLCNDFIPETVGQFTGLTDKNGTKIFEGDIVRYMKKETMVVSWRNESGSFVGTYSAVNFYYCASLMSANIYLEVIGNIHDNPELLNGGLEDA